MGGSPFHNDPDPVDVHPAEVEDAEILLYPNPTSGLLHIKWPDGIIPGETSFQLYGLNGNLLYITNLHGSQHIQLDQLNLSPGVYIVKISTPGHLYRKKIVYR
ncbi:MAG: T9SS type A sorting domain-containing protein [Bacteroidales bacterium]|nr:T9SS type A sorting domain-containing protein [Bacteroidales bacterium]